jgi:hypothetical protein
MAISVSLAEIRSWMNETFDLLERAGCDKFDLQPDHYWQVYFGDAFDYEGQPLNERRPPKPVIGSLSNDVEELREELAKTRTSDGALAWHLLDHLGPLLPMMASQTQVQVVSWLDD